MKLTKLLSSGAAMALAIGVGSAAFATPVQAGTAASQQFVIQGSVNSACVLNFTAPNINLGTISVDTTPADGPTKYFHMTTAGDILQDQLTGTGGCNANSTVTLSKLNGTEGLHNPTTAGFDDTVFTANIPYNFELAWSGSYNFIPGPQSPSPQSAVVTPAQANSSVATGAFSSNINVAFAAADPGLGLLAGTYGDTVTLTFTPS